MQTKCDFEIDFEYNTHKFDFTGYKHVNDHLSFNLHLKIVYLLVLFSQRKNVADDARVGYVCLSVEIQKFLYLVHSSSIQKVFNQLNKINIKEVSYSA